MQVWLQTCVRPRPDTVPGKGEGHAAWGGGAGPPGAHRGLSSAGRGRVAWMGGAGARGSLAPTGACPPQGHPLPADPADAARRPPGGHLEAAGLRGLHPPPGAWSGGARDPSTASALASWAIPPPPPTLGPESPAGQAGSVPTFPQAGTGGARGGGKRDVHCGRSIRMPRNLSLCKAPSSPVKAGWGPA